ncbi:MAG TPA: DUF423 domain-containing protein [Fimbriimonadaceae bacterium]|nr:DUF423 domain-containing protein [Fimbriimonadaceae bacterium]
MSRTFAAWGGILGFLAVALGAFGAHGLRERLSTESMAIYQTGVQYQMAHALALLLVAALADKMRHTAIVGWLFVFGVAIFSGSLYVLAITGQTWLGAITPFGGLCFLAGWAMLAYGAGRGPKG